MVTTSGVGHYTAAMAVARVTARAADAAAWAWALVAGADPADRYALVSAVLDLGATVCTARGVDCGWCPVEAAFAWPYKRVQLRFF